MSNKDKGSNFEREVVEILSKQIENSTWKRVPGSGAIGTYMGESLLCGDVIGEIEGYPKKFRVECKTGYNNSVNKEVKQFTLKKEWLDKIRKEANNTYSLPFLVGRFSNARSGAKVFVVMDLDAFTFLVNEAIKE